MDILSNLALGFSVALSPYTLMLAVIGCFLGTIIGSLAVGRPADRLGRRSVLFAVGALFLVSALGSALAVDWYWFLFFRFIGGLGGRDIGDDELIEIARVRIYNHEWHKPETFKHVKIKGKEFPEDVHVIYQVAPEDCTGCGLCVEICPAKDKTQPKRKAINMEWKLDHLQRERQYFDFFLTIPDVDRGRLNVDTIKGSQLLLPLFDPGGGDPGKQLPVAFQGIFDDISDEFRRMLKNTYPSLLGVARSEDNDTGIDIERVNRYSELMAELLLQKLQRLEPITQGNLLKQAGMDEATAATALQELENDQAIIRLDQQLLSRTGWQRNLNRMTDMIPSSKECFASIRQKLMSSSWISERFPQECRRYGLPCS